MFFYSGFTWRYLGAGLHDILQERGGLTNIYTFRSGSATEKLNLEQD